MIHFKAVVFAHHKRRDGTFPVKIRVTFQGRVRYLPTTITCTAADLTRSMKMKNADVIARCNELTDRLRREAAALTTFDLEGKDVDYVVRVLTERMRAPLGKAGAIDSPVTWIANDAPRTGETMFSQSYSLTASAKSTRLPA